MNDFRQLFVVLIFECMCARICIHMYVLYCAFVTYIRGYATLLATTIKQSEQLNAENKKRAKLLLLHIQRTCSI